MGEIEENLVIKVSLCVCVWGGGGGGGGSWCSLCDHINEGEIKFSPWRTLK